MHALVLQMCYQWVSDSTWQVTQNNLTNKLGLGYISSKAPSSQKCRPERAIPLVGDSGLSLAGYMATTIMDPHIECASYPAAMACLRQLQMVDGEQAPICCRVSPSGLT